MLKQAYAVLIFTALNTIYYARGLNFNLLKFTFNSFNVTKFMNTTIPIWTVNTTAEKVMVVCKVDIMRNITKDAVYFNRSHEDEHTKARTNNLLEGSFDPKNPSVMYVGGPGGMKNVIETLDFASKGYECGVFSVRYSAGNTMWRELRVKAINGTVQPTEDCLQHFPRKGYVLYNSTCKTPPMMY